MKKPENLTINDNGNDNGDNGDENDNENGKPENYKNGTGVAFGNKKITVIIGFKNNNQTETNAVVAVREKCIRAVRQRI